MSDLPNLKLAYAKAVIEGKEEFPFQTDRGEEVEFFTPYAKFLIQHMEDLKSNGKHVR